MSSEPLSTTRGTMKRFKYLTLAALVALAACAADLRAAEAPAAPLAASCSVGLDNLLIIGVIEVMLMVGLDELAFDVAYNEAAHICPDATHAELMEIAHLIIAYAEIT